jgi:hypothetical protein
MMTINDIKRLISNDEHRQLELKKTTGELKEAMHTACAFLNTDGGLSNRGFGRDESLMPANGKMYQSRNGEHKADSLL